MRSNQEEEFRFYVNIIGDSCNVNMIQTPQFVYTGWFDALPVRTSR